VRAANASEDCTHHGSGATRQDCPGWTAADLVGHMGAILGWIAKIVTSGQAVPRRDRETPPADRDTLAAWYGAQDRTVALCSPGPEGC
jgi:hypothetical protein